MLLKRFLLFSEDIEHVEANDTEPDAVELVELEPTVVVVVGVVAEQVVVAVLMEGILGDDSNRFKFLCSLMGGNE